VLVPFGGGGLSCGIATAIQSLRPEVRVYGCEVDTAAPLAAAFAAGGPVQTPRSASFVDGIGGPSVLPEMWTAASRLLAGSLVVSLPEVAAAVRHLAAHAAVVAEGAGGASVAAGLKGLAGPGRYVAVVSGGNIDTDVLATILSGRVPD
jgi:threonine dehydratase